MLRTLSISNYALISELQISLNSGFSVMTGETGAGKSIILGALGLIMGQRADVKAISEGKQKCVIEADFDISAYQLQNFFTLADLDYDKEHCIIRREISINGKSRSFINDTPVALAVLKELTTQLIDIHSQHENLLIGSNKFQLMIVDAVAKNTAEKSAYLTAYKNYRNLSDTLLQLRHAADAQRADADYILFQHQQLTEANLQPNELAEAEKELNQLNHAEEIGIELANTLNRLNTDGGIVSSVKDSCSSIRKISSYLSAAKELEERLQSTYIELKDIASEIESQCNQIEYNPERQSILEERVNTINSLLQKHRVQTVEELIDLRKEFEQKMQRLESYDDEIAALEKQVAQATDTLHVQAQKLSATRQKVKKNIEEHLVEQLKTLGIPHPQFSIQFNNINCNETGADDVQFMFAANKNQTLHNVSEVASGGEISRLMLCIKALIANSSALPTIIFDEIDTGVSGEIADSMGNIMKKMSASMQVISITHLPQIAAKGQTHYKVYKVDSTLRTETNIKCLTTEERTQEIAKMLSGANITDAAVENAKNLLSQSAL